MQLDPSPLRLHLGSDHAGYRLKTALAAHLRERGHLVVDHGAHTEERSDYPDYAAPVARAVREEPGSMGILVCGSGFGICVAANKIAGVRAVPAWSAEAARLARAHNDANVLCLGQRLTPLDQALAIADAFLATPFDGGRHAPRLAKIAELEQEEARHVMTARAEGSAAGR